MDFSMEIPSEKSRDLSPMNSIHIETTEQMLKHEVHRLEQSTMQTKGKKAKYEEKEDYIWTSWIPTPTLDDRYSSDSEDEDMSSPNSYKMILLRDQESSRLIQKFLQEPFGLKESKVHETDFSIEACFNRLASYGYRVMMVNYKNYEIEEITVKVNHLDVEWHRGTSATSVSFEKLTGIILGDTSSTFQTYRKLGGNLGRYSIQSTDCISVLSKFRNFDFATTDDQAKYDIYTVLSWKISTCSSHGPLIPMNRGMIALNKIRMKLNQLANSKCLFLKELLLLGLMKYHIINKTSSKKLQVLKAMIDNKLKLDQKMYRITRLMRPINFKAPDPFIEKFDNSQRVMKLQKKRVENIVIKDDKAKRFMRETEKDYEDVSTKIQKIFSKKGKKKLKSAFVSAEERMRKAFTKIAKTPH